MIAVRDRPMVAATAVGAAILVALLWWIGISAFLAWVIAWSIVAFATYGIDKRQARRFGRRVPEQGLHAMALVGGVIGAWAGRAYFRHKTQKPAFLIVLVVASILWGALAITRILL